MYETGSIRHVWVDLVARFLLDPPRDSGGRREFIYETGSIRHVWVDHGALRCRIQAARITE